MIQFRLVSSLYFLKIFPKRNISDFDIALLLLPRNLTFSKRVQMVCLPPTPLSYAGYRATVSGWGLTDGYNLTSAPLKLHEAHTSPEGYISGTKCMQCGL